MSARTPALLLPLLLLFPSFVAAQDPCASVLVPTREEAKSDLRLAIAMMKTLSKADYESHKVGGGGSLGIPLADGLVKASANYEDFQQRVSQFASSDSYTSNSQESRSYLRTYLSDESVRAWVTCRINDGGLAIYARHSSPRGFALRVEWAPPPGETAPIEIKIDLPEGGTFASGHDVAASRSIQETLRGKASRTYAVRHKASEPVRVIANTGYFTDDLLVEPVPTTGLSFDWTAWLVGQWCVYGKSWTWAVEKTDTNEVHTVENGQIQGDWRVGGVGADLFRIVNKSTGEVINYRRYSDDDTFGRTTAGSPVWHRCP